MQQIITFTPTLTDTVTYIITINDDNSDTDTHTIVINTNTVKAYFKLSLSQKLNQMLAIMAIAFAIKLGIAVMFCCKENFDRNVKYCYF
jgi:hypothetical protein